MLLVENHVINGTRKGNGRSVRNYSKGWVTDGATVNATTPASAG